MSSISNRLPRHVALCPFPLASHPGLMLLLARKIVALSPGIQISLFTTEPTATSLSASLSKHDEGGIRIRRIDGDVEAGPALHPIKVIARFMEVGVEILKKGMVEAEAEVGVEISCVVADGMMAFAASEIAEEKGVEWVALWTPGAFSLLAHMYTDQLREGVVLDGLEAHKEDPVDSIIPGFPPVVRIADLPQEILNVDYSFPVARILHLASIHLPKAAAIAINSFHPLETTAVDILNSIFGIHKILTVGPLALTLPMPSASSHADPYGCLPWLDTCAASSVVYIGFGSADNPPPKEFTSLAEALEATKIPFLWSLPDRFKPYLPQGFESCGVGKIVSWAPQKLVLGHASVGAHLTHCGWNSVLESIGSDVSLVCRPLGIADHSLNGRLAARVWEIGVEVEGGRMTKEVMVVALKRAMSGEEGKIVKEKMNAMLRFVEEAAEPDGSSSQNLKKFINIITG